MPDSGHKRFDARASESLTLMDLLADKAFLCGWDALLHVSVAGIGLIGVTSATLTNSETAMDADFAKRVPLLTNCTDVSLEQVQRFAQWYNGNEAQRLDVDFGEPPSRKVAMLNPKGNMVVAKATQVHAKSPKAPSALACADKALEGLSLGG